MIKKTEIIYLLFNDITQQEIEVICNLKTVGKTNTYIKMQIFYSSRTHVSLQCKGKKIIEYGKKAVTKIEQYLTVL